MTTLLLMSCLFIVTALVLWFTLHAVNRMNRGDPLTDRITRALKATGCLAVLLAVLDCMFGSPDSWPRILMLGVLLINLGVLLSDLREQREESTALDYFVLTPRTNPQRVDLSPK